MRTKEEMLLEAIEHDDLIGVKELLTLGVNVNMFIDGYTHPLHVAAEEGRIDLAKTLIEAGANLDLQNSNGQTPLHKAAIWGHTEIAKALIEAGAKLDVENADKQTPLEIAKEMNNKKMIDLFQVA